MARLMENVNSDTIMEVGLRRARSLAKRYRLDSPQVLRTIVLWGEEVDLAREEEEKDGRDRADTGRHRAVEGPAPRGPVGGDEGRGTAGLLQEGPQTPAIRSSPPPYVPTVSEGYLPAKVFPEKALTAMQEYDL